MDDLEMCNRTAEQNNPIVQFQKGIEYYYGTSCQKDLKKAIKYFKCSAEQGYIYAETSLGLCYRKGEGVLPNYIEAVKLFKHAAEHGDIVAIYNLAICYYYGQGVKKDYQKSADYFRQASEYSNIDENHKWSHIPSKVPIEPSSLDEALIELRKALTTIDTLNIQLSAKYYEISQSEFDHDIQWNQMEELKLELSQIKKELNEKNNEYLNLINKKEELEQSYEQKLHNYEYDTTEKETALKKEIDKLVEQSIIDSTKIKDQDLELKQNKNIIDLRNQEILKQNESLQNLQGNIESMNNKLLKADKIINDKKTTIDNLTNEVEKLNTQHPFIKKSNILRTVDFFAFFSLMIILLPGYLDEERTILNIIITFVGLIIEITSFILLKKDHFLSHSFLRMVIMCDVVIFNYLNDSIYDSNWIDNENFIYYFPFFVMNIWSAFVSIKKEIYITQSEKQQN